jgi:3-oxoacyl-[acyl-carrier protein] reductase
LFVSVKPLENRTAVVTGGSRGIGRAIVERLATDGAKVFFTYLSRAEEAASVASSVTSAGGWAEAAPMDLTSVASIRGAFAKAQATLAGIDIVVHNACTTITRPLVSEAAEETYDFIVGGNAKGGFIVLQEAARRLTDQGRLVNISSLDTAAPAAGNALYAASKAAVEHFTAIAARELGSRGITANTVSPGATDTSRLRADRTEAELQRARQASPLGRLGAPEDIANVVAFLVGPEGGWVTGQNIRAGGGIL